MDLVMLIEVAPSIYIPAGHVVRIDINPVWEAVLVHSVDGQSYRATRGYPTQSLGDLAYSLVTKVNEALEKEYRLKAGKE
jgi:hypothetical protein